MEKLTKNSLTIDALNVKLAEDGLSSSTLSILSGEKKVNIYRIKNNNLLDQVDNLFLIFCAQIIADVLRTARRQVAFVFRTIPRQSVDGRFSALTLG